MTHVKTPKAEVLAAPMYQALAVASSNHPSALVSHEIKYNLFYSIDADKINDIDEVLRVKALCLRWFAFKFKDTDAKAQILRHTEGIVES